MPRSDSASCQVASKSFLVKSPAKVLAARMDSIANQEASSHDYRGIEVAGNIGDSVSADSIAAVAAAAEGPIISNNSVCTRRWSTSCLLRNARNHRTTERRRCLNSVNSRSRRSRSLRSMDNVRTTSSTLRRLGQHSCCWADRDLPDGCI